MAGLVFLSHRSHSRLNFSSSRGHSSSPHETHALTSEISVMVASLAVGGFLCAWLGGLVPFLRRLGAPAITAAFLPSYLVYRHWLPTNFEQAVTSFTKGTNFIYLYITAIIVGSIAGMNRTLLLRGIAKLSVPLLGGSAAALLLGGAAGAALGLPFNQTLPMVVVPVMGGVLEKARFRFRSAMPTSSIEILQTFSLTCCLLSSSQTWWQSSWAAV